MKTKLLFIAFAAILTMGCKYPKYLPKSSEIDVNRFGSYIKLYNKSSKKTHGELISIDSNKIVLLTERTKKCVTVPIIEVDHFSLQYAKSPPYGASIPFVAVLPFVHGYYSIISIPIHLIVTVSVTSGGKKSFSYSEKSMTYDNMRMFARFPQGIPAHIDPATLK